MAVVYGQAAAHKSDSLELLRLIPVIVERGSQVM
jgi:hypothetical protein